ncbi:MAG: GntR family transcriptional regulator [Hydrogenophaga sp.]|jgi:GntR family transcriptional regulator of vanillate catabolism|nr:GntR family transcriptional regulator [Hydrogenophaga sp.]
MSAAPHRSNDDPTPLPAANESAQVRAQLRLRELILSGELSGGTRIAELAIVERLGMSRTPIRAALVRLEQEGLLAALPGGGYVVQSFTERDVADAIELRGTLEGLLARLAAERGATPLALQSARQCLDGIDAVLSAPRLDDQGFSAYVALNHRFHRLLCEMAQSPTIARQLDRVVSLPFASPSGFVLLQAQSSRARDMLVVAQDQHRQVLCAIEQRESYRAEAIMREHSRLAQRNLQEVLRAQSTDDSSASGSLPAIRLIRRQT